MSWHSRYSGSRGRSASLQVEDYFPEAGDDGRVFDEDGFNELEEMGASGARWFYLAGISGPLLGLGLFAPFAMDAGSYFLFEHKFLYLVGVVVFAGSLIRSISKSEDYKSRLNQHKKAIARAKRAVIDQQSKGQDSLMNELQRARMKGDVIVSGSGHTVLVNSQVVNSFNTVKERDPELARAITILAGMVENSKNPEAAEIFNTFHNEISKPKPDKNILKSLWTGLTLALPMIKNMTDIASTVGKYFAA